MKKNILIILLFLCFGFIKAQQTQFNMFYDLGYSATGRNVFATDSAYYMIGITGSDESGVYWPRVSARKFDTLGNFMWDKDYKDLLNPFTDGVENACVRLPNGYALPSSSVLSEENPLHFIRLYRFDSRFDTLWTNNYLHDTVSIIARGMTVCSDGGFAIVGFSKRDEATDEVLPESAGKGLLLRTDSLGNYLWHKTYGEWEYGNELYKVVQTPDGGFLCGGATRSYSSSHNWDWYLVKVDFLGNEEWHRTYGNSSYNDSRVAGITLTKDTNYVITGGRGMNNDEFRPYIKVLNKAFINTKTKTLPYQSSGAYVGQTIELETGDFIMTGGNRVNTAERTMINLTKFDEDFNQIWRRQYTAYDTTNVDNYMMSVDTCTDGGFAIGGWAAVYGGNTGYGNRLALLKTDSLGCDGTDWWDCSTSIMIKEYANSESFKLYPNPTKNVFFVNLENEYFDRLSTSKIERVAILDLTGKTIKNINIDTSQNNFRINIEDFKSGIYLVKVGDRIEKLIVQ